MESSFKEYGGFLPIELAFSNNDNGYYAKYNLISFNTVKAAISLIKKELKLDNILVPYYLCPNVIGEIQKNFSVSFFNIDKNLLPVLEGIEGKLVYLVNYFGTMDKKILQYVRKHSDTFFIIDNAHSFFCKPILRDNVINLYSCKKFFGVPDGGYLISSRKINSPYKNSYSSSISHYLIKSLEEGTNSCYIEKKEVDDFLNSNYSGISIFSQKLLSSIDYKKIKRIRKRNFEIYNKAFADINKIKCEHGSVPYLYPLNVGRDIKKALVEKRIYVPTLWNMNVDEKNIEFEMTLKNNTIFLPLDQRYCKNDIEYIVGTVKELLGHKNE